MAEASSALVNAVAVGKEGSAPGESAARPVAPDPWHRVLGLRCQMSVELPVPVFRVNKLMRLCPRLVLDTHWRVGSDVPIRINGQLIGWGEFDTVHGRLAIRVTEVAVK